jgi:hypothetical protein
LSHRLIDLVILVSTSPTSSEITGLTPVMLVVLG